MTGQEIIDYCMKKQGVYSECPFGPEPICARVERRIFAEVFSTRPWVTLKCEPMQGLVWREQYPGAVGRGWHCPAVHKPYNNTVILDGTVPDAVLLQMMDHSYERALNRLPKAARARVNESAERDDRASAAKGIIMGK